MLILNRLGWKTEAIASACDVHRTTVTRAVKKWDDYYLELPNINISQKRLESMVPQAITVFERNLNSKRADVAFKAAVIVLTNFGILTEGKSLLDDTDQQHSSRLVAEATRIIEKSQSRGTGSATKDSQNAPAPQDGGTPLGVEADKIDGPEST
jgi:hypothetical protein